MTEPILRPTAVHNPNEDQRNASNPAASVWVNASAGSGKTSVLTKRVMRLLLSGVRPEKILCLTYTRAGAAEMANRIMDTLKNWAVCDESALDDAFDKLQAAPPSPAQRIEARKLFAQVLSCPGGLRIRTIHAFCQEILSRFPIEAGLPPHFALIEEQDLETLGDDVLDAMLRDAEKNPETPLAKTLSALVATQGETSFMKILKEAAHASQKLAQGRNAQTLLKTLIKKTRTFLQLGPDDTVEKIRRVTINTLPESTLCQLATWWSEGSPLYSKRGKDLQSFLDFSASEKASNIDTLLRCFLKADYEDFADSRIAGKKQVKDHPEIVSLYKEQATRLRLALERIDAAEIAEKTEKILSFGFAYAERLAARKAARASLDYDDLILNTQSLLSREGISPWILYKLDNGLTHILVDEAQDTSLAQWNIVESLTQEFYAGEGAHPDTNRTLFVVGDEKQSIFSFQNADPEAFLSHRIFYETRLRDAGKTLEKIPLRTSFRSAPAVLKAVDAVFADEKARQGVSPDPIAHTACLKEDGREKIGRVEIWPLMESEKPETDKTWILPTTREDENDPEVELAERIAQTIEGWLARKETLPGEDRPIAEGDIMILLRRRGNFARLMVKALKAHKVPVTGVDRMRLIEQLPVMDLLAMVRFVLLSEDDLNLATLLRSPLIGLSEEQLMTLAIGRDASLWGRLKTAPDLKNVRDYLTEKLNEADFSTPFAFLSGILNAPCPANKISGRQAIWTRLDDESLDPIDELLNKAQAFGQKHPPSLQNFLHWLTQSDVEIKRELDRSEGQVRIMTIHASKGLEAPIVFLPDTTTAPRTNDMPKLHWSQDGAPLFLTSTPVSQTALYLWNEARTKQLEEYRRLLYVAMTRASRRLTICGWKSDAKQSSTTQNWYDLCLAGLKPLNDGIEPTSANAPVVAFSDPILLSKPKESPKKKEEPNPPLPPWATARVAKESETTATMPSYGAGLSAATPDSAFTRGRIIHRLLQSLPNLDPSKRMGAIDRFLSNPSHNLTNDQQAEIAGEVQTLLNDQRFAALFSLESLTEAPLTGTLDGSVVFRQVDRLCLNGNEVWIVDYKTNRPPPDDPKDVPEAYRQQMMEYRELLNGIYPESKVRTFLLWTYAPKLMEIA